MATTNHLGITYIEQSQSQKEVTANEAFARIDAVLNTGAINRFTQVPPVSPSEGDVYVVFEFASGEWEGHDFEIAYFDAGIWRFITPNEGMNMWMNDENKGYTYSDGIWVPTYGEVLGIFGLKVKESPDLSMGIATLSGGTVVINNAIVTNSSRIFLCSQNDSGTVGFLRVSARTANTSFTITSSSTSDNSDVAWVMFEPQ